MNYTHTDGHATRVVDGGLMAPPLDVPADSTDSRAARPGDRRLKVLHLSAGNLYGGVETFLSTLARMRHLAPEMVPEFGLCFQGRQWDELAATGAAVHDLGPVRISRPWTVWHARKRLRRILADTRPDVVVVHSAWPHAVFAPEVRRAGGRLVHFAHGEVTGRHWLERLAGRTQPDLVLAHTWFIARMAGDVFSEASVETWRPPVAKGSMNGTERSEVRAELGIPDGTVVILQASRLERWKGQAAHLEALALLRDVPGWECWLVGGVQKAGEAEFMAKLQSTAKRAKIADRVRFLGQRADVPRLMAAVDIFCQPNIRPEPFGLVFIEALYAGLPVVATHMGGAREIVTEDCGVLVESGDAAALASVLRGLIEDALQRGRLGRGGPARAAELCDPDRLMQQLLGVLSGLAAREPLG
jgi:glycosyltransferase involved in cell wall biosynthesis